MCNVQHQDAAIVVMEKSEPNKNQLKLTCCVRVSVFVLVLVLVLVCPPGSQVL